MMNQITRSKITVHDSDFERVRKELESVEGILVVLRDELFRYTKHVQNLSSFNKMFAKNITDIYPEDSSLSDVAKRISQAHTDSSPYAFCGSKCCLGTTKLSLRT